MNPGIFKTYTAVAAIAAYRMVKFGTSDGEADLATADTDALLGVTQQLGAEAAGERVDICLGGLPEITLGGAVTRGDPLTTDAQGRAITAAPAAGVNMRTIGFALQSGVAGDIRPFHFSPGQIQG